VEAKARAAAVEERADWVEEEASGEARGLDWPAPITLANGFNMDHGGRDGESTLATTSSWMVKSVQQTTTSQDSIARMSASLDPMRADSGTSCRTHEPHARASSPAAAGESADGRCSYSRSASPLEEQRTKAEEARARAYEVLRHCEKERERERERGRAGDRRGEGEGEWKGGRGSAEKRERALAMKLAASQEAEAAPRQDLADAETAVLHLSLNAELGERFARAGEALQASSAQLGELDMQSKERKEIDAHCTIAVARLHGTSKAENEATYLEPTLGTTPMPSIAKVAAAVALFTSACLASICVFAYTDVSQSLVRMDSAGSRALGCFGSVGAPGPQTSTLGQPSWQHEGNATCNTRARAMQMQCKGNITCPVQTRCVALARLLAPHPSSQHKGNATCPRRTGLAAGSYKRTSSSYRACRCLNRNRSLSPKP
jgi:hypothetical protein